MEVGDYVRCTRSAAPEYYTVDSLYSIFGFDRDGDPILLSDTGQIGTIGCPLNGVTWGFELVKEDEQSLALLELLRMSQEDVKAGRVMTREQLMERLSKD